MTRPPSVSEGNIPAVALPDGPLYAARPTPLASPPPAPHALLASPPPAPYGRTREFHDADREDDSPYEDEPSREYARRCERLRPARAACVMACVQWKPVKTSMSKPLQKAPNACDVGLYTTGTNPLGCKFRAGQYKAFDADDAAMTHHEDALHSRPIDAFLQTSKYNMDIRWWVDTTPFDRWHNPEDQHIGEHANHILAIVNSDCFQAVLTRIKMGWKLFLRDGSEMNWNGLIFDPYGMCRSVALARILHHCMTQQGTICPEVVHMGRKHWASYGDCGRCEECRVEVWTEKKAKALERAWQTWLGV